MDKPDQIVVREVEDLDQCEYKATDYAGRAKELPLTRDDEWEIRAKGTFEGGSQGTTSLYYFLFNKGTGKRHWIRKEDMGVIPMAVFRKWSPQ